MSQFAPNLPNPVNEFLDGFSWLLPAEALVHGLEHLPPTGWYDQNKVSLAEVFQTNLFALADPGKHLISQMVATNALIDRDSEWRLRNVTPQNALLFMLLPYVNQTSQRFAQAQNAVDMAMLACALERYRLARGKFPATPDALTPEFLENIPPDVVNGEPLHYQSTSNGSFKLYSIGWNGNDDGGVIGINQFGRYNPKSGDWVWQYPAKP